MLVEATLGGDRYRIVQASGGSAALERLHSGNVDLILLDWNMPGMSGVELARMLRADAQTRSTPIIMLTAYHDPARRAEASGLGIFAYLVKPFSPLELIQTVDRALK